jgi:hypothetical protein
VRPVLVAAAGAALELCEAADEPQPAIASARTGTRTRALERVMSIIMAALPAGPCRLSGAGNVAPACMAPAFRRRPAGPWIIAASCV